MSELPYCREAEEDCIAGFMFFPDWVRDPDFEPILTPEDFYDFKCREIFRAMLKLNYRHLSYWGEDELSAELARTGKLAEIGGAEYIHGLAQRAYFRSQQDRHSHEPQHYAVIVKEMSLCRAQLLKAQQLATEAMDRARTYIKVEA